ncbi:xylulokinase [Thermanaerothrix sp. 4228-RoL]|uniref:Xylulose kinase n=1 Tax=Thermanaerothrix solaris TaxID=3058434 RepID=A0ABU3NNQ7_9CHLR|nr:xylulokinase [Thermanaerothrix sp. 4228-RoL]MDT8898474.1 xylulokinase [Thermanaerothrix sp. 4228-RoL]
MGYYLGLDISTTSSKALIMDDQGAVVGTASSPHTLQSPHPLWSEQDPSEWWHAVSTSIRQVLRENDIAGQEVDAIGLTGQMHGLVLLSEKGQVLRPAILWNDQRTQPQCDEIHQRVGKERFIKITGNVALTGFTAPKILWVRENEPHIYSNARHVLLPKDYIRYRLTGDYAMDKADGSGTVLFDLPKRDWSREILELLDLPPDWFPNTYEGPEITGEITQEASEITGLRAGTPVVAGGGDQAAQAVGVGAVEPGIIALTVGTSGVVFASTPAALIEPEGRLHAFCHAVPGMWHLMGVMLSAAGSLQWYRDHLAPHMSFDDLLTEATNIPAGSEGLQFMPYLTGERTPYPDPLARGAWIGLTVRHGRGHMTRALLEGVAFGLKDNLTLIQNSGLGEINQVRVSGGGAKSVLWRQILANVLEIELVTVNTTEGAAYGAALLAAVGCGHWSDVRAACTDVIKITDRIQPIAEEREIYRQAYEIYHQLYPALKPIFPKMSK